MSLAQRLAIGLMLAASCGPSKHVAAPPTKPAVPSVDASRAAAPKAAVDTQLLRALAILATNNAPAAPALEAAKKGIDAGTLTLDAYIDSLLATDDFAARVAPLMILREWLSRSTAGSPSRYVLNHTDDKDPLYYLDDKPCDRKKAVKVRPWWDLDHEVQVCDDAYRPEEWTGVTKKGDTPFACLSQVSVFLTTYGKGQRCGCGPNLIRCWDSGAHRTQASASLRDELRQTVAYAVREGKPAETIFTSNETWRDRNAEYVRLEQTLEANQDKNPAEAIAALAKWPAAGQWAKRTELADGAHAGILTTPMLLYNMADLRQRMSVLYNVLWCIEPDSAGASPEQALQLPGADLQLSSAGWKDLAARPVCTNCHARLDYGLQFFTGWPNAYRNTYFVASSQQTGSGPFYGSNIEDQRGTGPLNPHGFAQLAVAQPEFRRCMAHDVGSYVFGDRLSASKQSELEKTANQKGGVSLRAVMRNALVMLANDWTARPPTSAAPANGVSGTPAEITVSKQQHELLDKWCLDCHQDSAPLPDFSAAILPRVSVVEMLHNVAFGRMPKDAPMDEADRRQFVESFVDGAWSGADAVSARAYFIEKMSSLPAYRPEVMFDQVHSSIGGEGRPWRTMEQVGRADQAMVTPGLVTIFAVSTIEACRAAHKSDEDVQRCLTEHLKAHDLAITPH